MTHLAARLAPLADRYPAERELGRGGTATVDARIDRLRDQPRFEALLERMAFL